MDAGLITLISLVFGISVGWLLGMGWSKRRVTPSRWVRQRRIDMRYLIDEAGLTPERAEELLDVYGDVPHFYGGLSLRRVP